MIDTAPATDRVALEEAQARVGLAGVDDPGFCPVGLGNILRRHRRNTAEALRKVEGDALRLQNGPGEAFYGGDGVTLLELVAVVDVEFRGDGGVGERHRCGKDIFTAEDAGLAGYEFCYDPSGCGDERLRGDIAPGCVFL